MPDSGQIKKSRKKKLRKKHDDQADVEQLSSQKKEKLRELDDYIENVLEEAGEDFLDQFKQIEGQ
jgi:vacuolar-type H+-ATPase subunit I/STV1